MKKHVFFALLIVLSALKLISQDSIINENTTNSLPPAPNSETKVVKGKFIPPDGKTLFCIGQDVVTINNYLKEVSGPMPTGYMFYTSTTLLDGLTEAADHGAGLVHADYYLKDKKYDSTVVQLALWMVGDLENVISGARNYSIDKLGKWIQETDRPVYLRIGYEFDGVWNYYEPENYVKAYRYIVDRFRANGITNISYVWNSAAAFTFKYLPFENWYPGDDYVDWVGISFFHQYDFTLGNPNDIQKIIDFAKKKGLPLAYSEATAYGGIKDDTKWKYWFEIYFKLIEQNDIKMISYIDADWDTQTSWIGQGWGDCRIQKNAYITKKWLEEISKNRYLRPDDKLYSILGFERMKK